MRKRASAGREPRGENTQVIRDLEKSGYTQSFKHFKEREEALEEAKELRKNNFFARVVEINTVGRIYNRTRYAVFTKEK